MSIFESMETAIGGAAMRQIAERVGLPPEQLQSVVGSLAPAILPQLHAQAQQGQLPNPPQMPAPGTDEAEDHGNNVLGSIFGSSEATASVAQQTANETGISADKIQQVLPQLASLAAAAVQSGELGQAAGGLGSLLSAFTGQRPA